MAVVLGSLLYIHIPKTGGSFVETVLGKLHEDPGSDDEFIDTSRSVDRGRFGRRDQHEGLYDLPASYRGHNLLVTVRNPHEQQVSLYEFGWWKNHPHDTFDPERIQERFPHFPELSFAEYLSAAYDWELLDPTMATESERQLAAASDVGFLTLNYLRFLRQDPALALQRLLASPAIVPEQDLPAGTYLPTHALSQALHDYLGERGFDRDRIAFIRESAPILPDGSTRSAPANWRRYYDDAGFELVRRRERVLFSLFPQVAR